MPRLIQSYADHQAKVRPLARAIVLANEELTYAELDRWSNSLARTLQFHGCRRGDRVGLLVAKWPLAIASILGILKADCIYVPLDVESPAPRNIKILDNSEPRLVLVDASGLKAFRSLRSYSGRMVELQVASIEGSRSL